MRIAITGATGNVGTALLRRLAGGLAPGLAPELVGVARRTPGQAEPPLDRVVWHAADLAEDACLPTLREAFRGADAVVNCVWGFQPSHRIGLLEQTGPGALRRVLEAVTDTGVRQVVHLSSVGAYAPKSSDLPVAESYPTTGVPSSPYSRHKAAGERILDDFEPRHPEVVLTRIRPGIVGQRSAGSELLRYSVPGFVPTSLLRAVPAVPLDRRLKVPMVHADDVAEAIGLALATRAGGAFNLAADLPVTAELIAAALGARLLPLPAPVLRAAVSASWHLRLQQVDPGWVDLAFQVPLLDTGRAERELGWVPAYDAVTVLGETVEGALSGRAGPTPVMRPRTVADRVRQLGRRGPVAVRRKP